MATIENRKIQSLQIDKLSESLKSARWANNPDPLHQATYGSSDPITHQNKQVYHNTDARLSGMRTHTEGEQANTNYYNNSRQIHYQFNFKKNKGSDSQINRLLELKQEYEILKNMNVQQSLIYTHKSNKEQSYEESSSKSEAISSKKSSKSFQGENKIRHLVEYEKKQLQMMLSNSMNKVEELLKNEIQYKRKIYELSNKSTQRDQIDQLVRIHKKEQKQLFQTIQNLRKEQQHLRELNKKLSEKNGKLEGELSAKEVEYRKVGGEKKKLDEQVYVNRQKYMMAEIQIKRLKMELQILQKDKNSEVNYYKRLLQDNNTHVSPIDEVELKNLRQQIKLKDHRYELLLKQYESIKRAKPESHSHDNSESIFKQLIMKLESNQPNLGESSILQEIRLLKDHLQSQRGDQQLEYKIRALQKIIEDENIQKSKFMEQLRSMSNDYDRLFSENSSLKERLREYQNQLRKLKKQLYGAKQELQMSQHAKLSLSLSREQNTEFIAKNIEKLEQENKNLLAKYQQIKLSFKIKEQQLQDEIRRLRRELDEANFKIEKLLKENQFNLQLANSKAASEIQLLNKQIGRVVNQRNQWKREFDNMKVFYQRKLSQLRSQTEHFNQQWESKITTREEELLKLRGDNDTNLNDLRNRYQNEQSSLLARLDSLMESNQRLSKQNAKFVHMESELYQLRQQIRRMYQLNTNIDHLWSIKETQYSNVNDIIRSIH